MNNFLKAGLKDWHKVVLIMLPILVAFYVLNCVNNIHSDDHYYTMVCSVDGWPTSDSPEIESISDIFESQYNHYFKHCGRVVVHSIVQGFCGIWGKGLFNIMNVLIFVLLSYLTLSIIDRSLLKNYVAWALVPISVVLIMPAHVTFYYSVAFAVNYLWALTFCVGFIYIWKYYKFTQWIYTIPLIVLSFFLGWSHEGFSLPIAGALCTYYLINRKEIFTKRCLLSIAFCCGVLVLIIAPGNWNRASGGGGFDAFQQLVSLVRFIFRNVMIILPMVAISIIIFWKFKFSLIWRSVKSYQLYLLIFLFSVLLMWVVPVSGRVFIVVYYWWLILLAIVLYSIMTYNHVFKLLFWSAYVFSLLAIVASGYYNNKVRCYENILIEKFIDSDDGLVFLEPPYVPSFLQSSYYDPKSSRNSSGISLVYTRFKKPAIFINKSVEPEVEKMLFSDSTEGEIPGGLGFRKTTMPFTYIVKYSEQLSGKLLCTISGNEGDNRFKRFIVEKIQPSRYQESSFTISNITRVTYKGIKFGIVEINDDDCRVLSIKSELK